MITYQYLEMRYGPIIAHQCLIEIERAAKINIQSFDTDFEQRLLRALHHQDTMSTMALSIAA